MLNVESLTRQSLCPVCLRRVPARYEQDADDAVRLCKTCPEHGTFRTVVWRGEPRMADWGRDKLPSHPKRPATGQDAGCPFDCGLCPDHAQHTCTAVLEVTQRCNLGCPTCFASSGTHGPPDPDLAELERLLRRVLDASGACNLQLSGGEPTVRQDLPDVVRLAKRLGFPFVQLNTNGLRLGTEAGYAQKLAQAGLDSAFFQFDGTDEAMHVRLRGKPLLRAKLDALDALAEAGVGVVLVPTVVPGVNDHDLGNILVLAMERAPAVRGVHFQPVSHFGRHCAPPDDAGRITLPELMRGLEAQTGGMVRVEDFLPPGCEHSLCSFHANYLVLEQGGLQRLSAGKGCCDNAPILAREGADKAKSFVSRQWAAPKPQDRSQNLSQDRSQDRPEDDLDRFLRRASTHMLAVSAMAFQDVWTLDLERLRGCCIHVVAPDGRLVPFCAYNLTAEDGTTLYRGRV